LGDRRQRTEVRGQRAEVRGQKTEDGGGRTEEGKERPGIGFFGSVILTKVRIQYFQLDPGICGSS
jgi:hypothetical protein